LKTIWRCEKNNDYTLLLKQKIAGTQKILRTKMNKMQKEYKYPELFHKDNTVIENKENSANMFNKCFTSVGPDLTKQINPAGVSVFDYLKINTIMFLSSVDENEVIRVLESYKNSPDAEGFSMDIAKHKIRSIFKLLTHILTHLSKLGYPQTYSKLLK